MGMMRFHLALFGVLAAGNSFAADIPAAMPTKAVGRSADKIWTTTVNSEVRYASWRSTYGSPTSIPPLAGNGSGSQVYVPFSASVVGAPVSDWKFEFLARSGYVWARQNTRGLQGEVSTLTDTALSGTATYTGWDGFIPFVTLNVNAPTGKAALYGPSRFARMDPDLVDIATYGEGWNVGPTVGVNLPVTVNTVVTLSAGHTHRNAFTKEGAIDLVTLAQASQNVDPGDLTTFNASVTSQLDRWSIQAAIAYATESTSYANGVPTYKAGDRVTVNGSLAYAWNDAWRTTASGYWTYARRNDILSPLGAVLIPEAFNSNSSVYRIGLDQTFTSGVWSLGPTVSYLHRDANSYNPITFAFIPAKNRWAVGGTVQRSMTADITLNARLERIWARELDQPSVPAPTLTSDAWQVSGGAVVRF